MKPRRELREDVPRAGKDVRGDVGVAVDVDPKRNLADPARVGRVVPDRAARGPGLPERESAVAPRGLPPVAAERRERHGEAGAGGAQFRAAVEVDALLAAFHEALLPGLGVLGGVVEAVLADEECGDGRGVAEVVRPDGARLGGAPAEKPRAVVLPRDEGVALAVARHAVQAQEPGAEQLVRWGSVVERERPRLRAVGVLRDGDGGVEGVRLVAKRNAAPGKDDLRIRLALRERRGVRRGDGDGDAPSGRVLGTQRPVVPAGGRGGSGSGGGRGGTWGRRLKLRLPEVAAAGGEDRLADADARKLPVVGEAGFHLRSGCRGCGKGGKK